MCLYCEYVVFDFEFLGLCLILIFFFHLCFILNFFIWILNFLGEKKNPENFLKKKNKTYTRVFRRGLKLVYSRVF